MKNNTNDTVVELEEQVQGAVWVMRLKNAITDLADVVELYDAADSASGCKFHGPVHTWHLIHRIPDLLIWTAYADAHFHEIRENIDQIQAAAKEVGESHLIDKGGIILSMLHMSSNLNTFDTGFREAYKREWNQYGASHKSSVIGPHDECETGWFLEDLKIVLRPWKKERLAEAETWLRQWKRYCTAKRTLIANMTSWNQ